MCEILLYAVRKCNQNCINNYAHLIRFDTGRLFAILLPFSSNHTSVMLNIELQIHQKFKWRLTIHVRFNISHWIKIINPIP